MFAIAATTVRKTGKMDYSFILTSKAPDEAYRLGQVYGFLLLDAEEDLWRLSLGSATGEEFSGYAQRLLGESSLQELLTNAPEGVILTTAAILPQVRQVCEAAGVELEVFEYDGELATSR